MKRFILIWSMATMMLCCLPQKGYSNLVINEIMQSNIDCIMDDINEYPDSWVELYNNGTSAEDLSNYKICDENDATKAYQLPSKTINAKGFVIIYCDKEDNSLHTNFRLESGKGALYLFKNGELIDKLTWKKQPAPNIAYGRKTEGSEEWGYQKTPTPGATNCGTLVTNILGEPIFSEKGRVLASGSGKINLQIYIPSDAPTGTKIRVTYDGSEPTESSTVFTSGATYSITSTKIIRAKLFCDGYMSPRSTTHSYIFHGRAVTLPVISIVTDNKNYYDKTIGIYYNGKGYSSSQENYKYSWRRPVNFEYYEGAGTDAILNQLTETRLMGGGSRRSDISSQIIYANKRFGTKRLEHELFPEDRPGKTDFKSIILRNGGNDCDYTYMRDAMIQRTMANNCDIDFQAYHPAIIYFNGTYKGILNMRERSQEDNIYTNYDGLEDFDMVENWAEVKNGDMENINAFQTFISETGHTKEEFDEWMETEEYMNYMIAGLYFSNVDWPGNNFMMWRSKTEDDELSAKWRFLMKDCEYSTGLYSQTATNVNFNTVKWINEPGYQNANTWANTSEKTRLFRRLMADDTFKEEFLSRSAIFMGDFLNKDYIDDNVLTPMYNTIKYEYPYHRKLINQWWPNFDDEVGKLRTWIGSRNDYFYKYLNEYYSWGAPTPITINTSIANDKLKESDIMVNGVRLTRGTLNGKFWKGREISLESNYNGDAGGKEVIGWTVTRTLSDGKKYVNQIKGDSYSCKMPDCTKYDIAALFGIRGDANMDDSIDVADITSVADYILNADPSDDDDTQSVNTITADANKDGIIDVADITAIASMILK